jgi:hypothetical protein
MNRFHEVLELLTGRGGHGAWSTVLADDDYYGSVSSIAYRRGHLVAGGATQASENGNLQELRPTIWYSPDGHSWRHVEHGHALGLSGSITQVIGTESTFCAVGAVDNRATVWLSPNGEEWSIVWQMPGPGVGSFVRGIGHGPLGYVAVGQRPYDGQTSRHAAIWTSPDGNEWNEVFAERNARIEAVACGRTRFRGKPAYLAVGSRTISGPTGYTDEEAAYWWSFDAVRWTGRSEPWGSEIHELLPDPYDQAPHADDYLKAVTASGTTFAIGGYDPGSHILADHRGLRAEGTSRLFLWFGYHRGFRLPILPDWSWNRTDHKELAPAVEALDRDEKHGIARTLAVGRARVDVSGEVQDRPRIWAKSVLGGFSIIDGPSEVSGTVFGGPTGIFRAVLGRSTGNSAIFIGGSFRSPTLRPRIWRYA